MGEVNLAILNSHGNITALVTKKYSEKERVDIARQIMRKSSFNVEQVGFIEKTFSNKVDAKLIMTGNEFCGNAIASLGAYLISQKNSEGNKKVSFKFEASGCDELTECEVWEKEDNYIAKVTLPLPIRIEEKKLSLQDENLNLSFIYYKGIQTIVINTEEFTNSLKKIAEEILDEYSNDLYSLNIVTLFSKKDKKILPLVYVPSVGTKIWENSCAIASASSVISLVNNNKISMDLNIKQPTESSIKISVDYKDNKINGMIMEERVSFISKEIIHINEE